MQISDRLEGRAVSARAGTRKWRHPWSTAVSLRDGQWSATVKPGYVNGRPPIYRTELSEQAEQGRDFGTNPLTGAPYFSSFVFRREQGVKFSGTIDIPLYLEPAIPLRQWRAVGADGSPLESVPQFFREQGVEDFGSEARGTRRLMACDLILHQPRLGLTSTITQENPFLGASNVRQVLGFNTPRPDDRLRVYAGRYQDPLLTDELSGFDPLGGVYEEATWDELRISTVYLLSPLFAKPAAPPDETWQAFVGHGLFWNLGWMAAPLPRTPDLSTAVNPLAGLGVLGRGLLAPITNVFAATANDLYQQATNQILARSQKGTWWTPTGGGFTTSLPPEEIVPAGGPSKAARQADRAAVARAKAAATVASVQRTLDPEFPYRAIGFPRARFFA